MRGTFPDGRACREKAQEDGRKGPYKYLLRSLEVARPFFIIKNEGFYRLIATEMFTVSRDTEITPELMCGYIKIHNSYAVKLNVLYDYYEGRHSILDRVKKKNLANNRIVINHAKYISLISAGYMCSSPLTYQSKSDADLDELNAWIEDAEVSTQDMDLATDQSIFGLAYELGYIGEDDDGKAILKLATVDPRDAFVVYENNVTFKPVAACYYYPVRDLTSQQITGYDCTVITDTAK